MSKLFAERIYTNELTLEIKKRGDMTIEEILSHELFSITVRNEAKDLITFFLPEEELAKDKPNLPYFDDLLEYALTPKNPDDELKELIIYNLKMDDSLSDDVNNIYQLNRNAANFLSSNCRKLYDYVIRDNTHRIFEKMKNFCSDEKSHQNPIFVGHFCRIFPLWLQKFPEKFTSDKEFFSKLYEYAVLNVDILGYSELLSRLIVDCTNHIDLNSVLRLILRHIIFYIQLRFKSDDGKTKGETEEILFDKNKEQKFQPLNIRFQRIPVPEFAMVLIPPKDDKRNSLDIANYQNEKNSCEENCKKKDSAILSYLLISIIRSGANENSALYREIQNTQDLIEYLLYIGIYGYENSSLSSEAFHVLDVVVNGSELLEIQKIEKKDIIDEYAELIEFRPNCLSLLHVYSFPIFWNHTYKFTGITKSQEHEKVMEQLNKSQKNITLKATEDVEEEKFTIKKEDLGELCKEDYTPNEIGVTPFLILTPIVMTEPSFNTELNYQYVVVLKRLRKERKECTVILSGEESGKDPEEIIKTEEGKLALARELEIDKIMIDWLVYRFKYPTNNDKECTVIEAAKMIYPLCPRDYLEQRDKVLREKIHKELKKGTPRAVINGTHLYIIKFLSNFFTTFFFEGTQERNIVNKKQFHFMDFDSDTDAENMERDVIYEALAYYKKIKGQAKKDKTNCGKKEDLPINAE